MIKDSDITVVVQGAYSSNITNKCIDSIRRVLPNAEIIFSTWVGTAVEGLEIDVLLLNQDPGGCKAGSNFTCNVNRMILSTQEGCRKASRNYILKIRSDVLLDSGDFLNIYNKSLQRREDCRLFSNRVVCSSYFFKKYVQSSDGRIMPVPFHIGDWAQFGLAEDIRLLYEIPLVKESDFSRYFLNCKKNTLKTNIYEPLHRLTPEQYLLSSCVSKIYPDFKLKDLLDYSSRNIAFYEDIVVNNFIILDPSCWRFVPLKEPYHDWFINGVPEEIKVGMYSQVEFERVYLNYFQ